MRASPHALTPRAPTPRAPTPRAPTPRAPTRAGLLVAACLAIAAGAAPARADTPPPVMADVPLGRAEAPVTVIEYASFTCPHCAAFLADSFDKVKRIYIDTGKVRWVFRDFPLDRVAVTAAVVARCGGTAAYGGFVETLFRSQRTWIAQSDPVDGLAKAVRVGGLGRDRIDACLADKAIETAVLQSELQATKDFGVDETPTFIINGQRHAGEMPYEQFAKLLDAALQSAGK